MDGHKHDETNADLNFWFESFSRMALYFLLSVIFLGCDPNRSLPGEVSQGEAEGEHASVRPDLAPRGEGGLKPKTNKSIIVYERFDGHELTSFHTNEDLLKFLTELSQEVSTMDNFRRPRIRPNMKMWDRPFESVRIGTGSGRRSVDFLASLMKKPVYLLDETGVFDLNMPDWYKGGEKLVIKYRLECEPVKLVEPHSIVLEAWFMSQLAPRGLTTNVVYYSDPELTPRKPLLFKKIEEWTCADHPGTTPNVRYLISEKAGKDMHDHFFFKRMFDTMEFADKIRVAGQMILYLEKLHDLNVVHGDAHIGNWIIKDNVVSMIDFGKAKVISVSELRKAACSSSHGNFHVWATKWEMLNCPYSYRDDLIQAVFMMAIIFQGIELREYVASLAENPSLHHELLRMKNAAMFFEYSPSDGLDLDDEKSVFKLEDLITDPDPDKIDLVRKQFAIISQIASDDERDVASKPDYDEIKKALGEILYAVDDSLDGENFEDLFKLINVT